MMVRLAVVMVHARRTSFRHDWSRAKSLDARREANCRLASGEGKKIERV